LANGNQSPRPPHHCWINWNFSAHVGAHVTPGWPVRRFAWDVGVSGCVDCHDSTIKIQLRQLANSPTGQRGCVGVSFGGISVTNYGCTFLRQIMQSLAKSCRPESIVSR